MTLLQPLGIAVNQLISEFDLIPNGRKALIRELTAFIRSQRKSDLHVQLNFICTHNSRRSHLAQIWAQTAAWVYQIDKVTCYSGGTEVTAFHPNAVRAMREIGFDIQKKTEGTNPEYTVRFSEDGPVINVFSKKFNDKRNPGMDYVAIMTCTDADEKCPIVVGMKKRISLPFNDPKKFDGTREESEGYLERTREIGREILFCFSEI